MKGTYKTPQIDALDGVRGLAALIVILSHTSNARMYFAPFLDFGKTGKYGVFLFFILSALLLTYPVLVAGRDFFSVRRFSNYWMRRVLRILPLYLVFLAVAYLSSRVVISVSETRFYLPFSLNAPQLLEHVLMQAGKGVAWSIPVEFKYYVVLPFFGFLFYLTADSLRKSMVLLAGLIAALFLARHLFNIEFVVIHTLSYLEAFFIGAMLSVYLLRLQRSGKTLPYSLARIIGIFGLVGLVIIIPSVWETLSPVERAMDFRQAVLLVSVFWAAILIWVLTGRGWLHALFASPPFRFLGLISFSLYLVHSSVINLVKTLGLNQYASAWLVLGISIAISCVTYALIEKPFANLLRRQNREHPNETVS